MTLDERLRRELERAGRPADPSGVYEHLIRRRERRRILRKVQAGALAVAVVVGSAAGVYGLSRVFGGVAPEASAPSVRNGRLAYAVVLEDGGGGEQLRSAVMSVEPDGSDPTRLAEVDGFVTGLDWSPDGRRIALVATTRGGDAVYVMAADGAGLRRVASATANGDVSWSPDGGRLAVIDRVHGTDAVVVMNADGSGGRQVTDDTTYAGAPDWSPDGAKIAFVFERPDTTWDIATVDLTTGAVEQLTDDPASDLDPQWSPDGSQILFRSRRDVIAGVDTLGDQPDEIYVMNADGTGETRLTHDSATDQWPTWSPDGTLIAFTSWSDDTEGTVIAIVAADGSDRRSVSVGDVAGPIAWQPLPTDDAALPTPSPTPAETHGPTPSGSPSSPFEDIGLGFPVCDVTSVRGAFAPGVTGTAYAATKASDLGGCPKLGDGPQVVAVDVTGDGLADASYGPVECDPFCSAFAAPDVDGDGTDELLIQNVQFSIAGLHLYDVRADEPAVIPVTVSTPGYPEGGLPPGLQPQLWIGGDAFDLDTLRCVDTDAGRVLIQTSATQVPPDDPTAVWRATATWFTLSSDGTVAIVDTGTFEEPVRDGPPTFGQGNRVCDAPLPAPYRSG